MDKTKEAIVAITQVTNAYVAQGRKVIGYETLDNEILMDGIADIEAPRDTKRIAVIYFD